MKSVIKYNTKWAFIAMLSFFALQGFSQNAEEVLKVSNDSISRIKIITYEGSLYQYKKNKPGSVISQGTVVLQRSQDSSSGMVFIAGTDVMELIYDGRFGFIVNHKQKTVDQINPQKLLKQLTYQLIISEIINGFNLKLKLLNQNKILQDSTYWILTFKPAKPNDLSKVWINKSTMLPEVILKENISGDATLLKIANIQISKPNTPYPGSQIAKYIESYTLLPITDIGIAPFIDSRDSLVGRLAPDFSLTDFSGKKVMLSDYKGKYVILDFWETWCGPCRMSMPHLEELYKLYHQRGLEIIGLTKDNPLFAGKVLNDKHVTYLNLISTDKVNLDYKVVEIPQYYLINPEGKIIYASKNGFERKIEDMIIKELKR